MIYDLPRFEIHPFAAIFPLVDDDSNAFKLMLTDMCANGMTDPALIYEGKILDGVTRYRICEKQQDVEFIYEEFKGDPKEALDRSLSRNLHRRHLSESGRAMSAVRLARTRDDTEKTREWAADLFSISHASVHHALTVLKSQDAALIKKVDNGGIRVSLAAGISKLLPSVREQAVLDNKLAIKLVRISQRNEREKKLGNEIRLEHNKAIDQGKVGVYGVIYIDPPWTFETCSDEGKSRSAENHYDRMSNDDIRNLVMPAAKDCVLFMWTTTSQLRNAVEIMEGWGFIYKSCGAWHKTHKETGYWFRDELELLLVGTKGSPVAPVMGSQMNQVVKSEQGGHSAKPEIFGEAISKMYPTTPSVELFARRIEKRNDRWIYIGNEIDGRDIRDVLNGNVSEYESEQSDIKIMESTVEPKTRKRNGKTKTQPQEEASE